MTLASVASGWGTARAAPDPGPIRDKTLVAWVSPANLTQRGGSVLTLDDGRGHFDGVVFGELQAGRWMAGSDFFRRTAQDQAGWPAETADARTRVQVAITYQGQRITVYRDGREYARYTAANPPQVFDDDAVVVMGRRHLDQGGDGQFVGSVDDARVYGVALTAAQVGALVPNAISASEPAPLAWWDFESGKAVDRMRRFGSTILQGDARIAQGRLHLDGAGANLMATKGSPVTGKGAGEAEAVRAFRERLLLDPHRPGYHFVTPEGTCMPFDPNGAIYWKGRYHLFYIFQDRRGHNWGHVSSTDLFHWRHHPTGLVTGMFSGNCFVNKEGRPTMCYHQVDQGNAMAVAVDDELNEWRKLETNPITPKTQPGDAHHGKYRSWDPFGWLEGDTYYAIFGGEHPAIAKAPTLGGEWKYVGDLMGNAVAGVGLNEDVSCADFFRLGNQHMLLCISHRLGCRYYLGDWQGERFLPRFHEMMSWVDHSYFAPESLLDDRGRRIMWAWIFDRPGFQMRTHAGWSGTLSLPRVLTLDGDGRLRMNPPEEIERLRYQERSGRDLVVPPDGEVVLDGMSGDSLEVQVEMSSREARQFGIAVACAPGGEERTPVFYDADEKKLKVDTTRSSLTEGPRSVEAGPLELGSGETLKLRVFVDRSVVEVFANEGRQAVMRRIYPSRRDSLGLRLFSRGGESRVASVRCWQMSASNPF